MFASKQDVVVSPYGRYRLEYFKPGFPYPGSMTKQIPMFVRLYDHRTGRLLGESEIVDMNGGNGRIFWPSTQMPEIQIGMEIVFPASPEVE